MISPLGQGQSGAEAVEEIVARAGATTEVGAEARGKIRNRSSSRSISRIRWRKIISYSITSRNAPSLSPQDQSNFEKTTIELLII